MEFSEDWFTKNIPVWDDCLSDFRGLPVKAIELGSFEGRSSVWLMENILTHFQSRLDCVDKFEGDPNLALSSIDWKMVEKRFKRNTKKYDRLFLHEKDTIEYLKERTEPADLIYVDANHTVDACLQDGVLSHILLKKDGIIIFDDYLWSGIDIRPSLPKMAIDSFMNCFHTKYEILNIGYQVVLKKKVL